MAMYGRHGESPIPIVAASTPADCFDCAYEAVRIAVKYMTPVYLLSDGYLELPISSEHALRVESLPPIHKDPFDRLLVAQSIVEGVTLLTVDQDLAQYPAAVRRV